jgi:hypothetical protein
MAIKGVKRVWEVCEPHPDVFSRDPDPSLFAISLHHVMQGIADRDYTDPARFFSRTYMTRALSDLLERVVGRLAGQGRGAPILRLETPFGGGKTHTMTALFHIARYPEVLSDHEAIKPILERLNLRELPRGVHVAVLDGRGLEVQERNVNGVTIRTLWGELAFQLGGREGYEMVAALDGTRYAPGSERLTNLLQRYQPALILMDEVLDYFVKARAVKVGDSNLMEQTASFLGALTAAVSATTHSALIVALPASSLEVPIDDREVAERMFQHIKKVLGRMELVETPGAQDEVFGVLRRRLFHNIGNKRDHKNAVEAMQEYYGEYSRFFPDRLRSHEYRERMLEAYPFHPELVDLLYERWGPHPQFQRTRGALRLMALVLRRLRNQRPGSALLIQPHHIDLSDRHIRAEVVRLLDSKWDAIATGDVLQKAGEVEQELGGEYLREALGRGVATCAFLYSVSAATRDVGATEEEIRTAVLRPDLNPAMVSEVLGRLSHRLWYLRYRGRRYFFTAKPNMNQIIQDFENGVTEEQIERELVEWLNRMAGKGGVFQVVISPPDPHLVPDRDHPTLVVLSFGVANFDEWMAEAVQYAEGRNRVNKNMLVFLVPDKTQLPAIQIALKRWLALDTLVKSPSFKELDKEDQEQVKEQLRDKESEVEALLLQAYKNVYRPSNQGTKKLLVGKPVGSKNFDEYVRQVLEQNGEFLERISPEYLNETLQLKDKREVPLSQVSNLFTGVPGQPIPKNPRVAWQQAVKEGIKQGLFSVRVGEQVYIRQEVPEEVLRDPRAALLSGEAPLPPPQVQERGAVRLRVRTSAQLLYPLLKAAERLKDLKDASASLEVYDRSGEIVGLREELEKLFRDYGCTSEWQNEPPA